jgi:hypothetical protein
VRRRARRAPPTRPQRQRARRESRRPQNAQCASGASLRRSCRAHCSDEWKLITTGALLPFHRRNSASLTLRAPSPTTRRCGSASGARNTAPSRSSPSPGAPPGAVAGVPVDYTPRFSVLRRCAGGRTSQRARGRATRLNARHRAPAARERAPGSWVCELPARVFRSTGDVMSVRTNHSSSPLNRR